MDEIVTPLWCTRQRAELSPKEIHATGSHVQAQSNKEFEGVPELVWELCRRVKDSVAAAEAIIRHLGEASAHCLSRQLNGLQGGFLSDASLRTAEGPCQMTACMRLLFQGAMPHAELWDLSRAQGLLKWVMTQLPQEHPLQREAQAALLCLTFCEAVLDDSEASSEFK